MKIEIHVQDIRQTVDVKDASEALSLLKVEAANRAPIFLRGIIKGMGDIAFAHEVVKRNNTSTGRRDALPQSAQAFLDWAVDQGFATIIEP